MGLKANRLLQYLKNENKETLDVLTVVLIFGDRDANGELSGRSIGV